MHARDIVRELIPLFEKKVREEIFSCEKEQRNTSDEVVSRLKRLFMRSSLSMKIY